MPVLTLMRAQRERALGLVLLAAGALSVAVGWASVSGSATPQEQLSYLVSAGLGGLLCLGIGVTALLEAGLRDEQQKLAELAEAVWAADTPDLSENSFRVEGRTTAVLAVAVAAVVLGGGWAQAAGASSEAGAVPGLTTGIAGLLLVAAVAAVRLLRLRASIEQGKAEVVGPLAARYQPAAGHVDLTTAPAGSPAGALDGETLLVAPGLTRYHRATCVTLSDVDASAVRPADLAPGLRPCQICEADSR